MAEAVFRKSAEAGGIMKLVTKNYFFDWVACRPVRLYKDRKGRLWMKRSRWSFFRVAA